MHHHYSLRKHLNCTCELHSELQSGDLESVLTVETLWKYLHFHFKIYNSLYFYEENNESSSIGVVKNQF